MKEFELDTILKVKEAIEIVGDFIARLRPNGYLGLDFDPSSKEADMQEQMMKEFSSIDSYINKIIKNRIQSISFPIDWDKEEFKCNNCLVLENKKPVSPYYQNTGRCSKCNQINEVTRPNTAKIMIIKGYNLHESPFRSQFFEKIDKR